MSAIDGCRCRPTFGGLTMPETCTRAWLEAPDMPSFGMVSLLNRMVVGLLAGLGFAALEWLPPVDGIDGESWA